MRALQIEMVPAAAAVPGLLPARAERGQLAPAHMDRVLRNMRACGPCCGNKATAIEGPQHPAMPEMRRDVRWSDPVNRTSVIWHPLALDQKSA
jgi:hypothetical protein